MFGKSLALVWPVFALLNKAIFEVCRIDASSSLMITDMCVCIGLILSTATRGNPHCHVPIFAHFCAGPCARPVCSITCVIMFIDCLPSMPFGASCILDQYLYLTKTVIVAHFVPANVALMAKTQLCVIWPL